MISHRLVILMQSKISEIQMDTWWIFKLDFHYWYIFSRKINTGTYYEIYNMICVTSIPLNIEDCDYLNTFVIFSL